ncbi:MAG TPA: hypothetical protein ENN88_03175 [Candidatus Coatesbacteria bacterium]|nr:hypothetical protein [Candidatus Coatesbacteria bacterium]
MVFCDDGLGPSEVSPLADDPPPPADGFWRISGEVYAPYNWNPIDTPGFFRIWLCCWAAPYGDPFWVYLSPSLIEWTLHYISMDTSYWTFDIVERIEPGWRYFEVHPLMWSSHNPNYWKPTYVRGYVHEGHVLFVLKDEDFSYQPKNPYYPHIDFRYVHLSEDSIYWEWTDVSLDLRD